MNLNRSNIIIWKGGGSNEKRRSFFMGTLLFIISAMLIPNVIHALYFNEEEEIPIYLEIIDVFSKEEFNELFKEEEYEILRATGREILFGDTEVTLIYRGQPFPAKKGDINLFLEGKKIPVNLNGTFTLPILKNRHYNKILSLDNEAFVCSTPSYTRSNQKEIVFRLSSEHILDCMQKKEEFYRAASMNKNQIFPFKEYGSRYYPGDWVHCNRFNGPLSDCIHYDKKTDLGSALRNFFGSDCEASVKNFGSCVSFIHQYCNLPMSGNTPAACSRLTHHENGLQCSDKFHTHFSPAIYHGF